VEILQTIEDCIQRIESIESIKHLENLYAKRFYRYFEKVRGFRGKLKRPKLTEAIVKSMGYAIKLESMEYLIEKMAIAGFPVLYGDLSERLSEKMGEKITIGRINLVLTRENSLSPISLGIMNIIDYENRSTKLSQAYIEDGKFDDARFYSEVLKQAKKIHGIK